MDPKKIKGKEFFTIELDLESNNVTLYVNGESNDDGERSKKS